MVLFLTLSQPIDSGATRTIRLKAFVGSKQMDQLEQLGESWTEAVEFGRFLGSFHEYCCLC